MGWPVYGVNGAFCVLEQGLDPSLILTENISGHGFTVHHGAMTFHEEVA